MQIGRWRLQMLDPGLFMRKMALLVVFTVLFIPIRYYELNLLGNIYIGLLILLHVYFVLILIWRVRWKTLAEYRRSFILRMVAVAFFILLLGILNSGASFAEFLAFLGAVFVLHVVMLLFLCVILRRTGTPAVAVADPAPAPAE